MRLIHTLFFLFIITNLTAQTWSAKYDNNFSDSNRIEEQHWHVGFKIGGNLSKIDYFQHTLISDIYNIATYKTKRPLRKGLSFGAFAHWKTKPNTWGTAFAIQPEITYTQQGSLFSYEDINEFEYTMKLQYNYVSLSSAFKLYVWDGLHLSFIPQIELITSPTAIQYLSNYNDVNPSIEGVDQQIESNLRQVLKAENHFTLGVGIGYEYRVNNDFSLITELRYHVGTMDMVETLSNTFYMEENSRDRSRFIQLSLGAAFPL